MIGHRMADCTVVVVAGVDEDTSKYEGKSDDSTIALPTVASSSYSVLISDAHPESGDFELWVNYSGVVRHLTDLLDGMREIPPCRKVPQSSDRKQTRSESVGQITMSFKTDGEELIVTAECLVRPKTCLLTPHRQRKPQTSANVKFQSVRG